MLNLLRSYSIWFVVFALFLGSCSPEEVRVDEARYVISIARSDCSKVLNMSEIIDSVSYVLLETNEQCVLGSISRLVFRNGRYYIFDRPINQVLVFDRKGSFLYKYDKKGKGPFEYAEIYDMTVDNLGNVHLITSSRKFIVLSASLEPVAEYVIDNCRISFAAFNDHYAFENSSIGDGLYFTSKRGKMLASFFPNDEWDKVQSLKPFVYYNNQLLYIPAEVDTVFSISPEGISYHAIVHYEDPVPRGFRNPVTKFGGTFNVIPDTYMHGIDLYSESEQLIHFRFCYTMGDYSVSIR